MTTTTSQGTSTRGVVATGAIAGVAAGLANVVLFLVAKAAGVPFEVSMGGSTQPVLFVMPFAASLVALLLGSLLLKALARSARGVTIWTGIAVLVFAGYTALALSAATSASTGAVLTLMHVVVLAVALRVVVPAARRSVA